MSDNPDLIEFIEPFLYEGFVSEVLFQVKSGKEATVFCCRGTRKSRSSYVAAKVYRPLTGRGFRNDAAYSEGRVMGKRREQVAFAKKTDFGKRVQHGMWVANEYETLRALHSAGADVPRPIALRGCAILMELAGHDDSPAPPLREHRPSRDEAQLLFRRVMGNIERFLSCNVVHSDLSPYNVLYWNGHIRIIDFPQAVDPRFNSNARMFLGRDIENLASYFERFGVECRPWKIATDLWNRFRYSEL
ncbi:MAG: RIO1 family regulatory kinase/ATPase [Candidatus Brocadiia bacterium]